MASSRVSGVKAVTVKLPQIDESPFGSGQLYAICPTTNAVRSKSSRPPAMRSAPRKMLAAMPGGKKSESLARNSKRRG